MKQSDFVPLAATLEPPSAVSVAGEPGQAQHDVARADSGREVPDVDKETASAPSPTSAYGQILKASGMIGGSSAVAVLISLVRTKAMALMLGPAGFGLNGTLVSIVDLARVVAGMGISSSGVRQMADAARTGDKARIARTAAVLRWTTLVLGVAGAAAMAAAAWPISVLTFGNADHTQAIVLLSMAVLFGLIADGQGALLQGLRRIGDIAKITVIGSIVGTVATISLVAWLRQAGIAPALVAIALSSLIISWVFRRRVPIQKVSVTRHEVAAEAGPLLRLGLSFMVSGLIAMGAAYAIRIILLHRFGLGAAGLYQAAWALGGLYVGFVLQAMGTDFLPRLTSVSTDNTKCNRVVNEQAEVSLLLAGPGVLGTMVFAEMFIPILYSGEFAEASSMLRWFCLGMTLRVVIWPMSFIIVAQARQALFLGTDLVWGAVYVALAWVFADHFGPNCAGMAFFAAYVVYGLMIYPIVRRLTGFRWSSANRTLMLYLFAAVGVVLASFIFLPRGYAVAVGAVTVLLNSHYSLRRLLDLVVSQRIPKWLLSILSRLRLTSETARQTAA